MTVFGFGGAGCSLALFDGFADGVAGGFDAAAGSADGLLDAGSVGSIRTPVPVPLPGLSSAAPAGSVTTCAEQPTVTASTAPVASATRSVAARERRVRVRVDVLGNFVPLSATELSDGE